MGRGRIAAWTLAAAVVAGASGVGWALARVDGLWLGQLLTEECTRATESECRVGEVELEAWRGRAVLHDVVLVRTSERRRVELQIPRAEVDLAWLPLLRKELRIEHLEATKPRLLVSDRQTEALEGPSWRDVWKKVIPRPEPVVARPVSGVRVGTVRLTEGVIVYRVIRADAPRELIVEGVELTARDLGLAPLPLMLQDVGFEASLAAPSAMTARKRGGEVSISGVDLAWLDGYRHPDRGIRFVAGTLDLDAGASVRVGLRGVVLASHEDASIPERMLVEAVVKSGGNYVFVLGSDTLEGVGIVEFSQVFWAELLAALAREARL